MLGLQNSLTLLRLRSYCRRRLGYREQRRVLHSKGGPVAEKLRISRGRRRWCTGAEEVRTEVAPPDEGVAICAVFTRASPENEGFGQGFHSNHGPQRRPGSEPKVPAERKIPQLCSCGSILR